MPSYRLIHVVRDGSGDTNGLAEYTNSDTVLLPVHSSDPSESNEGAMIYNSSDSKIQQIPFGSSTSEFNFRGDISGDGKADLTFWEPISGIYTSLLSEGDFNLDTADSFSKDVQLGLYYTHIPLPFYRQNGKELLTVVDHSRGLRYSRENNEANGDFLVTSWGLPGDSQG